MNNPEPTRSLVAPLLDALTAGNLEAARSRGLHLVKEHPGVATQVLQQLADQLYQRGANKILLNLYACIIDVLPVALMQSLTDQARELTQRGQIAHAVRMLELLRARTPADIGLMQQLARRYQMLGRDTEALELLERILRLYPNHPDIDQVRYMQIVSRMIRSRFHDGMDEYDIRFKVLQDQWRELKIPRWRGEPLAGKRLYIWGEQGIGDILMFAGFLPYLQSLGPSEICVGVLERLIAPLQRSYPGIRVVENFPEKPCPEEDEPFDYSMPMADVLRYCLPHFEPRSQPARLKPRPDLLAEAQESLKKLGNVRKIGISWFTTNTNSAPVRNIPLPLWEPVFSVPSCVFFSLQHGEGAAEQVQQMANRGFRVLIDTALNPIVELEKLIALTAAMDEVISIQATAGHVGGALGLYTTVLRSKALDFSWAYEPCPWYASVHIEKQEEPVVWEPMMARVAAGLKKRVEETK